MLQVRMLPPSRVPSFCPTAEQFVLITTNSPSFPAESVGRKESVPCLVIDLKSQVVGGIQTGRYRQNPAPNRPNSPSRHIRPKHLTQPLQSKPAAELWRDQSHTKRMEFRRTSPIPAIDTPLQLPPLPRAKARVPIAFRIATRHLSVANLGFALTNQPASACNMFFPMLEESLASCITCTL